MSTQELLTPASIRRRDLKRFRLMYHLLYAEHEAIVREGNIVTIYTGPYFRIYGTTRSALRRALNGLKDLEVVYDFWYSHDTCRVAIRPPKSGSIPPLGGFVQTIIEYLCCKEWKERQLIASGLMQELEKQVQYKGPHGV